MLAVACFWLTQRLGFDPLGLVSDSHWWLQGPLYYLLLMAPFAASGLAVALLLTRHPPRAARLYGWDLAGAGVGALLLPALVSRAGGSGSILGVAVAGFTAALLFSGPGRGAALAALGACLAAGTVPLADRILPISITPLKPRPPIEPILTRWNSMSRVELFERHLPGGAVARRFVIDGGTAATGMLDLRPGVRDYLARNPDDTQFFSGIAYPGKLRPKVLVIGSGGGTEVVDALHYGARQVTAIEVNPTIVSVVSAEMQDFWGGLFEQPEVRLVADEARSALRRSADRYDAIVSIHTISNAAVASGAMALTENYVLTREAFEDYFDHLEADGIVLFSRPEAQLPRLMATAREALLARGIRDARAHFLLFRSLPDGWERSNFGSGRGAFEAELLVKKTPLSAAELAEIRRIARLDLPARDSAGQRRETLYAPDGPGAASIYAELAMATNLEAIYRQETVELRPATDDRPFFNHLTRWSSLDLSAPRRLSAKNQTGAFFLGDRAVAEVSLVVLLLQAGCVALLMILLPLIRLGRRAGPAGRWRPLVYFAALGFGFIVIEMSLLSRMTLYLGQPAYSISLVLGGLLVCSGLGALLSGRLPGPDRRAVGMVVAALLAVLAALVAGIPTLFHATLGWPLVARCAVALAALAPLGVLLGMPFPLGIAWLDRRWPDLVPWAWGVNAFFTVIGTVLCLMIAMTFGFNRALAAAAVCYLAAMLVVILEPAPASAAASDSGS
ncbi:MAG: hypothetical protein R2882_07015 [Gemmatimonadales bacterium]